MDYRLRPDWFAIIYVAGLFYFAGRNDLLSAALWVVFTPIVLVLGVHDGRQSTKR